ncbi:Uncharacterised protein [uncultured archaeon]|nr:Uncharacterised protein [uncultured archaeon]
MVKSERKEAWMRILVAIISGIILKFWGIVVLIVGVLNWLIAVFSGKRDKSLAEFCEPWNTEMYKYTRYLSGVSNKRPFPFSDVERMSKFG